MNFVEKLQSKPRFIRIQILWISVVLAMIIIIFFWLVCSKLSLQSSESNQEQAQKQSIPSLFGTIKEDFSILKKSLQAGVMEILGESKSKEEIEFEAEIWNPKNKI